MEKGPAEFFGQSLSNLKAWLEQPGSRVGANGVLKDNPPPTGQQPKGSPAGVAPLEMELKAAARSGAPGEASRFP